MLGPTHKALGLFIAINYAHMTKQNEIFILFSYFSSTFPDIDTPNSKIGSKFPPLSKKLNESYGHRGKTHSIYSCLITTGISFVALSLLGELVYIIFKNSFVSYGIGTTDIIYFARTASVFILIGYFSHLIGDLLNQKGIQLLYPSKSEFSLSLIRTNTKEELILRYCLYTLVTLELIIIIWNYIMKIQ
jgi:inner membrane protein